MYEVKLLVLGAELGRFMSTLVLILRSLEVAVGVVF